MQYNLLNNSYISPNTISGNVSLSIEEIENIISINGSVTISGVNGDIFCIDSDLGDRTVIDQIKYYFSSSTASGVVASGIEFYYKDDDVTGSGIVNEYLNLTTNIGNGYYYTTVSDPSAPRYIRLVHTVSGTSITGDVVGLSVLNDDTVVDFGSDGTLESTAVLTSLSYLDDNDYIKEIEIYNDGNELANAYIMLEPQLNDVDALLSISASKNGPWTSTRDEDLVVVEGSTWIAGNYNNTNSDVLAKLRLNDGQTVGTYITHVFRKDYSKFTHIDINEATLSGSIIATDTEDYTSTIEIRSDNTMPLSLSSYKDTQLHGDRSRLYLRDRYVETDIEYYDMWDDDAYDLYIATGNQQEIGVPYPAEVVRYNIWIDDNTSDYILLLDSGRHVGRYWIHMFRFKGSGPNKNKAVAQKMLGYSYSGNYTTYTLRPYFLKLDVNDGIWTYFWMPSYTYGYSGYDIDGIGYYLIKYDSSLSVEYKYKVSSDFIVSLDVDYDTGYLWYIPIGGINGVYKLDTDGTILKSYTGEYTTDLKGLCANDDGGCWIIDGDSLYRLDSDANVIDSILNVGTVDLKLVAQDIDESDYLWIADGSYIKRIMIVDGRVVLSVDVDGPIEQLIPKYTGVWVACNRWTTDAKMRFIGKLSETEEKTLDFQYSGWGQPGVSQTTYDSIVRGSEIPRNDDQIWNSNLKWNKVNPDKHILPRETYHQLRLTLRRSDVGIDSPTVDDIYLQDSVRVDNIYPGQSKTIYLKISIPEGTTIGGDYSSMLRVWWEIPV